LTGAVGIYLSDDTGVADDWEGGTIDSPTPPADPVDYSAFPKYRLRRAA
jgi:hypothetical protein